MVQAGNRIRTGDLNLGKVALYQLSYACVFISIYPGGPAKLRSRREATFRAKRERVAPRPSERSEDNQLSYACVSCESLFHQATGRN